jgi:hypothetical protein
MAARSITKFITSPSKVAQALDWKKAAGSVLSLSVVKDRIDLAVASHPAAEHQTVQQLPSIPIRSICKDNQKVLDQSVVEELAGLVQDWKVCGIVVHWPVQKEGRCGAPCGRVLNVLDQITALSKKVINSSRPICLWDSEHHIPNEDEWGRDSLYGRVTNRTEAHSAAKEQYADHNVVATEIWKDFFRSHWPELYLKQHRSEIQASIAQVAAATEEKKKPPVFDLAWLDSVESGNNFHKILL